METQLMMTASAYLMARLALMAGVGCALYWLLRPARATVRSTYRGAFPIRHRPDAVPEDHC